MDPYSIPLVALTVHRKNKEELTQIIQNAPSESVSLVTKRCDARPIGCHSQCL
jgi:hypothetical protein